MKKFVAASLTLAALVVPALATAKAPTRVHARQYQRAYSTVATKFGRRTPGRNIVRDGMARRRTTDADVVRSLGVLYRMLAPPPRPRVVVATRTASSYSYATVTALTSAPTSYGGGSRGGGGYCGAYQFDQSTWSSVGMSGSPCGASPAAQDHAAALLYAQRGSEPWPNCGRYAPNWSAVRQCENSGSYAP